MTVESNYILNCVGLSTVTLQVPRMPCNRLLLTETI